MTGEQDSTRVGRFAWTWLSTAPKAAVLIIGIALAAIAAMGLVFLPVLVDGYLSFGYTPLETMDSKISQYSIYTHIAEFVWLIILFSGVYAGFETWGGSNGEE